MGSSLLCLMSLEFYAPCTGRSLTIQDQGREESGRAVAGSLSCSGTCVALLRAQEVGRGSPCCSPSSRAARRRKQHMFSGSSRWGQLDPCVSCTSLPAFISPVQCDPPSPPPCIPHRPAQASPAGASL